MSSLCRFRLGAGNDGSRRSHGARGKSSSPAQGAEHPCGCIDLRRPIVLFVVAKRALRERKMTTILEHPQGRVEIGESAVDGRRLVQVQAADPDLFVAGTGWRTAYPPALVEQIMSVKGAGHLCDELRRDEDPTYTEADLRNGLLGYVAEEAFEGARLLDFGCGCGASTAILGRLFPGLRTTGIELLPDQVAVARARLAHHGIGHVDVFASPDPSSLPPNLGQFDFILLSAVWEHLLPAERRSLLPMLWSALKPGGILFLNQTPHRWSPWENHTTYLPGLNYLPAPLALRAARRYSKRVEPGESWEELLRRGTRGGSVREITSILRRAGAAADVLEPRRLGGQDRVDLWYRGSATIRWPLVKRGLWAGLKGVRAVTGVAFLPILTLAIFKES